MEIEYQIKRSTIDFCWIIRVMPLKANRIFWLPPNKRVRLKRFLRIMLEEPEHNYAILDDYETTIHKIQVNV